MSSEWQQDVNRHCNFSRTALLSLEANKVQIEIELAKAFFCSTSIPIISDIIEDRAKVKQELKALGKKLSNFNCGCHCGDKIEELENLVNILFKLVNDAVADVVTNTAEILSITQDNTHNLKTTSNLASCVTTLETSKNCCHKDSNYSDLKKEFYEFKTQQKKDNETWDNAMATLLDSFEKDKSFGKKKGNYL